MPFPPGPGPSGPPSPPPSSPTPPPPDTQLAPIVAALQKEIGNLQMILSVLTQLAGGSSHQPDSMMAPSVPHPSGPPMGASGPPPSIQGLGR